MKLEEKSPIRDTTRTNSSGLFRNGKTENPIPCARREMTRILFPLPVLSRMPPQAGESPIVSIAGMREISAMRRYEALSERRWIGRNGLIIPVEPNAEALDTYTGIRVYSHCNTLMESFVD